jgi:hypothetical protein
MRPSNHTHVAWRWASSAALAFALVVGCVPARAQEPQPAGDPPAGETEDPTTEPVSVAKPDIDAASMPLQQYADPSGRFGFVAPAKWGRLPSATGDEVVFQGDSGDSLRVSVMPLTVDSKLFLSAYVDTYLKVLSQTFTNVKFLGQRELEISFRKATDFVFTAEYQGSPVLCHQLVVLGGDKVLYVTFAGFGSSRTQSEQLFQTSLLTLWLGPGFGGATTAGISDPNAPAFVISIPEGWVDQGAGDGNSHMFRPAGARPTSAYISMRVTKLDPNDAFSAADDSIVATYTELVRRQHPPDGFEIHGTRKIFLGGEPAVRFDYGYISNYGIRRSILTLCVRKGYLVAVSCDAAQQSFGIYERVFEGLVSGFRFK